MALAIHAALGVLDPALQPSAAEAGPIQFIHIPKNGGTSIEHYGSTIGLAWAGDRHDWPGGPTPLCAYSFPFGGENRASDGGSAWHVPPRVWKENGADPYSGSETFCVVRNPYTRLVSEFIHEQRAERAGLGAPCAEEALNAWVHDVLDKQALRDISDSEPLPPDAGVWDCHLLPASVYTSDSVGVTVGSGRRQLGWGLRVARWQRPCTLLAVRPSWLVYSLGATLLAGRGAE